MNITSRQVKLPAVIEKKSYEMFFTRDTWVGFKDALRYDVAYLKKFNHIRKYEQF